MTEEPHLTSGRRARACEVECEALSGPPQPHQPRRRPVIAS
jgi:hypothetical protein